MRRGREGGDEGGGGGKARRATPAAVPVRDPIAAGIPVDNGDTDKPEEPQTEVQRDPLLGGRLDVRFNDGILQGHVIIARHVIPEF